MADLETDDAMLKLVSFVAACLTSTKGVEARTIINRSKRFHKFLSKWIADDTEGEEDV